MKRTSRLLLFILISVLIFSISVPVFASGNDSFETLGSLSAKSYYLMDASTQTSLSEGNADVRLPMASTTKIMTCIVAMEHRSMSDIIKVPREAVGTEGSSVYLTLGEELTLEELLYALMLESANDAAVAIAIGVSGSVADFVSLMNEKARRLGMNSTVFMNPHGLPCDGHFSTARDLCLLMAYCMGNPSFAEITSTKTKSISAPNEKNRYLSNHNRLLRSYEQCIGGKTGFTKVAGRCLVSAAEMNGKILVCATLSDPDDWNDHEKLYRYGFSLYEERCLASIGSLRYELPVVGGQSKHIFVSNSEAITMLLLPGETPEVCFELPRFVYAPTAEGTVLGEAVLSINGTEITRTAVCAESSVNMETEKPSFWTKIMNSIKSWWQKLWNK